MRLLLETDEGLDGDVPEAFPAQLAAWIRNPQQMSAPAGVEARRLEVYRRLFFNNIENFVREAFPFLRSLYSEDAWHKLIASFIAEHKCRTPYFREISREFLVYLEYEYSGRAREPAYFFELAHYEWVMHALEFAVPQELETDIDPDGDLLQGVPVISSLVCSLRYNFAVQHFSPGGEPPPQECSFLLVYRDSDYRVQRMEINLQTASLLKLLAGASHSGDEALHKLAGEFPQFSLQAICEGGLQMLQKFRSRGIVLGIHKK